MRFGVGVGSGREFEAACPEGRCIQLLVPPADIKGEDRYETSHFRYISAAR